MKKSILTCLTFCLTMLVAQAQPSKNDATAPKFKWETTQHNFGETEHNQPIAHTFTFTNVGDAPLIISKATASCSCTIADYTKTPVMPGKTGFVKATYNAKRVGTINKSVTVTANTPVKVHVLSLKGTVKSTVSKK